MGRDGSKCRIENVEFGMEKGDLSVLGPVRRINIEERIEGTS